MDAVTFDGLKTAATLGLLALGALVTVGKSIEIFKSWRKPRADKDETTNQMLADHEKRLEGYDDQLEELRAMSQVQCVAMKALLSHEINGNSVDKLRSANDQLDAFLIGVGK